MKFLVQNCSCLQNPCLGSYRPQIPVLSVLCPQLNLLNSPEQNSWVRHWPNGCLDLFSRGKEGWVANVITHVHVELRSVMRGGLAFLCSIPHDVQRDEFTHVAFAGSNIPQSSVKGYIGPCPALKFWAFCSQFMTPSLRDYFFLCVCISECIFISFGWKCERCFKERTVSTKGIECAIWGPGSDADEVSSLLQYYTTSTGKQRRFGRPKCLLLQGIFFYWLTLMIGTALLRSVWNYSLLPIDTAQRRRRLES